MKKRKLYEVECLFCKRKFFVKKKYFGFNGKAYFPRFGNVLICPYCHKKGKFYMRKCGKK